MIRLRYCLACGDARYPSREICGACLSDRLEWRSADSLPGRVVARTILHHSNEPRFQSRLPLTLGLVQFDAGPVAVCFLAESSLPGDAVRVRQNPDGLLMAE